MLTQRGQRPQVSTIRTQIVRFIIALLAMIAAIGTPGVASALSVQEIARLAGQGETTLWGLGFVVGLPGTGDPSENMPLSRQLAQLLERGGNPVPDIAELAKGKNIAMVMVTCTVPREGARRGDALDVFVQAWHRAPSLQGGRLFITPLQGPLPGQGVFAFAEGPLIFETESRTSGRVRAAARVSRDIKMNVIDPDGTVTLLVEPAYAGWTTSQLVASSINSERQGLDESAIALAVAVDERSVRVTIPPEELPDPASFISSLLETRLDPSLLSLPARVIVNERRGTIVVTGNVEISPAAISHKDLVITTITPPRPPTPEVPLVERSRWTDVTTLNDERRMSKLQDLLAALRRLDVPVSEQIAILTKLHRIGSLHAEMVIE